MNRSSSSWAACLARLPGGRQWLPVGSGESGDHVFRRSDGEAYAKVADGERAPLLEAERRRTQWLSAFDLGAPPVLDWIEADGAACLVTGAVRGVPASDLDAPALVRAWPSIAERIKALHALPVRDCPFARGLSAMVGRAEDVVARGAVNPDFLDPEDRDTPPPVLLARLQAELPMRLDQEAGDLVVCHGDACLPNIMVDPETLRCTGLVDLGRLGTADRHVDLALLIANARETWTGGDQAQAARDRLFAIHAIEVPDQARLDFYLRLDPLTWG
ncbi:APH(3'') family aminoglycoside O-phosphotransferase [Labrys wisconsinensis]|uniref:Aminoglycoside 3'-phosphotransferase n=1 Tax=Labrys wisconsinensis TaxID=425677 RepID=A0ABU0JIV6_9HYPH|nr:APH(3'') family aminoglycoside O-phosphotransferase [Labrys wisconsinensis]MDQ0473550.1 streptomycin 3'-kinase [Labrys wisconsinensis]